MKQVQYRKQNSLSPFPDPARLVLRRARMSEGQVVMTLPDWMFLAYGLTMLMIERGLM